MEYFEGTKNIEIHYESDFVTLRTNDEDLTDEKLREASESLLPNIQSECSKLILSIND